LSEAKSRKAGFKIEQDAKKHDSISKHQRQRPLPLSANEVSGLLVSASERSVSEPTGERSVKRVADERSENRAPLVRKFKVERSEIPQGGVQNRAGCKKT
jgi:hypothetical protein